MDVDVDNPPRHRTRSAEGSDVDNPPRHHTRPAQHMGVDATSTSFDDDELDDTGLAGESTIIRGNPEAATAT